MLHLERGYFWGDFPKNHGISMCDAILVLSTDDFLFPDGKSNVGMFTVSPKS